MKKITLAVFCAAISLLSLGQAPQSFQYQAVVRDAGGTALQNQAVNFQLSIISDSTNGPVEYVETHTGTLTNNFGIVTLSVGSGTTTDNFAGINWGIAPHFIKVEADPTGGTSYINMGTTQLLSVPYALYSETAGNAGQTYTAGSGINISGTVITNTAPDQTVILNGGGATSVTGTYPNFTISSTDNVNDADADPTNEIQTLGIAGQTLSISDGNSVIIPSNTYTAGTGINVTGTIITNTAPDQTVALTQGGATTITGTYPNFTISSTDNVNDADADPANELQVISISNDTLYLSNGGSVFMGNYSDTLWKKSGISIYNTNPGNVGVGITNPVGKMVVQGSVTAPVTDPLFEVKNAAGQSVFVVYPDSVHIYVKDTAGVKSNKGGFAVSGRNNSKAFTSNYFKVTPDSTRIYTGDTLAGFGVGNIGSGNTPYLHLTPDNFIIAKPMLLSPLIWCDFAMGGGEVIINGTLGDNATALNFFVNGSSGGLINWSATSDKKFKKNITTITNPIDKVKQLRGINFEWNDTKKFESGIQMGFIAQEVEKVIPEVVRIKDGNYAMQYAPLTALLVEAIKEQQKQIESLKIKLEKLNNIQSDFDNLKAQIEQIKSVYNASAKK